MRTILVFLLTAVAAFGAGGPAMAQIRLGGPSGSPLAGLEGDSQFSDPVALSAQFTAATAEHSAVLMITAEIAPGWHVYSLTQPPGGPTKTKIELTPSPEYQLAGEFRSLPQPTERVDNEAWVGLTIEEHAGQVTWYAPIELAAGVDPAALTIAGQVRMLACKDSCIPVNKDFTARLSENSYIGLQIAAERTASSLTPVGMGDHPARFDSQSAVGSIQPEGSEVKISGRLIPGVTRAGDGARLEITLTPAPHWHVYANADRDDQAGSKPTLIAFAQLSGLKASRPTTAAAVTTDDSIPEFGTMRYHTGPVTWEIPIEIPPGTKPGKYPITGVIGYQACETRDDGLGSCELPKAVQFMTKLVVGDVAGSVTPPLAFTPTTYKEAAAVAANWATQWNGNAPLAEASSPSPALGAGATQYDLSRIDVKETSGSLVYYIVLAFVGGIILNLMPCVLPVIGLKVMSFVQQAGHSRSHALVLNLWYSAGIVSVFLLLGFLAAWIGLSWGGQFGSTAFTVTLAAIVFAMALSLLGVWEIPIPGFFGSGAIQDVAAKEGPFGAFIKGAITTVLATPCTGPFMASAIAWAVTQSMSTTLIVFGSLGLGMASPYLVIGVFPELLRFLPKPGQWMETFKQVTGFILLATVVFLLSFMEPTAVVPTVALLLGVGLACWLLSRTPLTAELSDRLQSWALAGAVVLLAAVVSFGWLYAKDTRVDWQPFSLSKLQQVAVEEGRTVLVDFSADWCITCKALEKTVLHNERVQRAIADSGAVTMYGDYTDYPPEIERTIRALKSNGVPVIAIFPGDRPYEPIVFRDGYTAHGLIAALQQATGSKTARPSQAVAAARPALN
jgi:thiol:disulfide interchange protein/DsbC/DsbD-like thiol-disulfide interchange protein